MIVGDAGVAERDGVLYVAGQDQYIHAMDLGNGRVLWRTLFDTPLSESPTVIGDRVYQQVPSQGLVHQGQLDGIYVVNQGRAEFRLVQLGAPRTEGVEILSGVSAGDGISDMPMLVAVPMSTMRMLQSKTVRGSAGSPSVRSHSP